MKPDPSVATASCGSCHHFHNQPADLEAAFPGMTSMGSGFASVRAHDGLCTLRDIYLPSRSRCGDWIKRS